MRTLQSVIARDKRTVTDASKIQIAAYQQAGLTADANVCRSLPIDVLNDLPTTLLLVLYSDDEPVATVRLLQTNADVERTLGWSLGLELGSKYDLATFHSMRASIAEVTRLAVRSDYRGSGALAELLRTMKNECHARGITHLLAGSTMGTDHEEDAQIAVRVAAHKKLSSEHWHVPAHDRGLRGGGQGKPFYDADAQAKARAGEWDKLRLPPILQLYSLKLGARFMGDPTYDPRFQVYSLPLIVPVNELRLGRTEGEKRWSRQ